MCQFFMRECKLIPKFSARAGARKEKKGMIVFIFGLLLVAGGVGTMEIVSFAQGIVVALIGIAVAATGLSQLRSD